MISRLPATLRLPAIWFAAALLLGSSAFYLALDARMASKSRQLSAQETARKATHDLRQTPERLARDRAQAATYIQLRETGFLGEENRLDWVGNLAHLRASLGLRQVSWRLAPRLASNLSPGLHSSTMVLEIAPADSQSLDQFLAQLRALARGRFTVRDCTLQPDGGGRSASCTLDWWTWDG